MLPPEPPVLLARQGYPDAQAAMLGSHTPLGFFSIGWYGTSIDDERGSFCIVRTTGPLLAHIGDFLHFKVGNRSVCAYCIGSQAALLTDVALTRRTYAQIALLAIEPTFGKVALIL